MKLVIILYAMGGFLLLASVANLFLSYMWGIPLNISYLVPPIIGAVFIWLAIKQQKGEKK